MNHATINVAFPLRFLAGDGSAALFPQALIYNEANTLLATVNLTHVAGGLYSGSYTPSALGYFAAAYTAYTDNGHTTAAAYDKEGELTEVTATIPAAILDALLADHLTADTVGESLTLMRGLLQHNQLIDTMVYNASGLLTSFRLRIFPSSADTTAGTNALATYTGTAVADSSPNDSRPVSYKLVRTS